MSSNTPKYHFEHVWVEGPEVPLRYGTCLSRLCSECGIYEEYDWHGHHRDYTWGLPLFDYLEKCEEDDI